MNKQRLKKLADFLYTNPSNFKYDNASEDIDGEIYYCAAGFTAVVFPRFCKIKNRTLFGLRNFSGLNGIVDFCIKFYDITNEECQNLFFGGAYRMSFDDITPTIAADVIMKFISEKEKELAL